MKTITIALLLLSVLVSGCGDDAADTTTSTSTTDSTAETILTAAEVEWCTLGDASDETAFRFDQIFEGGLALGLPMDALNAQASALRTEFETSGMTPEEAVVAVGQALLDEPVFQEACKQAHEMFADAG